MAVGRRPQYGRSMTVYLAALAPAVVIALFAGRRVGAMMALGLMAGLLLDWRLTLVGIGPLLLVYALVHVAPRPWNDEARRSLRLNALWAAARVSTLPLPIGAGILLTLGVPRVLPVLGEPALDARTIGLGVITFLAADLTNYLTHRLRHAVPLLWRFHEIHHADRALGPLTARRLHLADQLLAQTIRLVPLVLFGPQYLLGFLPWAVVRGAAGYYHHAGTRLGLGPLGVVCTTPDVHRLHHSTRPEHHDTNFGGVLIIWDKLFGTYTPAIADVVPTGVPGTDLENELDSDRPLPLVLAAQFAYPFRGIRSARFSRSAT